MDDLAYLEIAEAAPLLQRGELSPVELTRACLDRVSTLDDQVNTFITVRGDSALAEARTAEEEIRAGNYRGPLHGIPIAHKDLYYTAGVRTTAASTIMRDFVPDFDGTAVAKWKQAGTVLLGKLNMHELASGGTNELSAAGVAHNPWNLEHITGGSSGGSGAALAAGMCFGATGSDTAGSIRIPAHCCGVSGIKPTYGRVSCYGVVPLSWSLDHAGPMARSVRDCALLLQAMAGFDPRDSGSVDRPVDDFSAGLEQGVRGLRVGVPTSYFTEGLQPEVERAWRAAVQVLVDAGAERVEVTFTSLDQCQDIGSTILRTEMATFHREWFAERPNEYAPWLHERFADGNGTTGVQLAAAMRARTETRADFRQVFERCDVVVVPVMPRTAKRIGADMDLVSPRLTYPFNLSGVPSVALPCGFDDAGLPIGMQVGAPWWQEGLALRVGHSYQQATDWHKKRAPLRTATAA